MRSPLPSIVIAALAIPALTPGCGGGAANSGGAIALADYGREYVKVFCRRVYTCCDAAEIASAPDWGPSEADCVTAGAARLSTANLQAAVASGRVVYHGDRARKCIDNVAALSCADFGVAFLSRYVPDCPEIAEGTVPEGGQCTLVEECATGFCDGSGCAARAGLGEACQPPYACQPGLYCSLVTSSCAPIAPIGGACDENPGCENYNCPPPVGTEPRICSPQTMCNGP